MTDDADVSRRGFRWIVLHQRTKVPAIPGLAEHGRKDVARALRLLENRSEFRFVDHQTLVTHTRIRLGLFVADESFLLDFLPLLDGITNRPYQSLPTR